MPNAFFTIFLKIMNLSSSEEQEQSRAVTATHWKGSSQPKTKACGGLLFVNQQQSSYKLEMSWEFSRKKKTSN